MSNEEILVKLEKGKTIGEMEPLEMAAKLREMGDLETADEIEASFTAEVDEEKFLALGRSRKPWEYRTHQIGHFPLRETGSTEPLPIQSVGVVEPDPSLLNGRIDIHLDRLRIQEYPGRFLGRVGDHYILVNFKAQNQLPEVTESVSFNQTYKAHDGDVAGVIGYPVFIGLSVGSIGAAFTVETVNVKNSADEAFLGILDSDPFKSGLSLLTTAQPAIKPFSDLATGAAKYLANRDKNVKVQEFYLGLDTKRAAAGASLLEGNYVAIQVPSPTAISWDDWQFVPALGAIVSKVDGIPIPYNYLVFRITRHNA